MIQLLRFYILCLISILVLQSFMDLQITKLHSLPLPCALAFYFSRFSFYVDISSVVILIFYFSAHDHFARAISNRWPDHSLSFHYLYKYIYKNTADDMSAPWTRHRRYRSILWVMWFRNFRFQRSHQASLQARKHPARCHPEPHPQRLSWAQTKVPHPELNPLLSPLFPSLLYPRCEKMLWAFDLAQRVFFNSRAHLKFL